MSIVLIKYNAGNTASVTNALERLGVTPLITDDPDKIAAASHVILPGVGHAGSAMAYLKARGLDAVVRSVTKPFLGICVGLQLLCDRSEEGDTRCIGVFGEKVRRFPPGEKVPHMGWNQVALDGTGLGHGTKRFYFLHSYAAETGPDTIATCDYGGPFSAIMRKDNFLAVQFHPEKSGTAGAALLERFLAS
jgi:imidazole glycerol-phosphate synthase subunit HisH